MILAKMSKGTLLKKLGLSEKFLRKVSCARKSQLGVRILKLTIIITALSLTLLLGHRGKQDVVSYQMMTNERDTHSFQVFKFS